MSVVTARSVSELRRHLAGARSAKGTVSLVPTMGALHVAHAALIEQASRESASVVVSIFVNPLQFGPGEDYLRYPRPLEKDLQICESSGADLVFVPQVEDLYAMPQQAFVEVARLGEHLCGAHRPGHFRGVATVVAKLFNIVQPDLAYFGEKDFQQLRILQRMVSDLNFPVTIVPVPTVREADGLALSSRNLYLQPAERAAAPALYRALRVAQRSIEAGESSPAVVKAAALKALESEGLIRVEYFEVVDTGELQPVDRIAGEVRVAAAIWIGKTRLIDNIGARN